MKIKRYLEKDSRTAMARIRAEMGSDAVILSNKKVNGLVELVAARDFDEAALADNFSSQLSDSEVEQEAPSLVELQRELEKLRGLVEGELSQMTLRDVADRPTVNATLYKRMSKLGVSRALCGSIVDRLPARRSLEDSWRSALGSLTGRIQVQEDSLSKSNNIIALVGSTGVGKTTTIAKLAARSVLRHGGKQVALVTTDCYRIGGQEQLATFANYLGIPVVVATDAKQLEAVLAKLAKKKLVLIDTAGMSQRDIRLYEQFQTLNSVGYDIETHVVLSATAQPSSLNEVVRVFGSDALTGAIITKLDEATSLGGVLDTAIKNRLKLSYFSMGQRVPEDIMPARAEYLVNAAVEHMAASKDAALSRARQGRPLSSMAI